MDVRELLTPDWGKVQAVRRRTRLPEILDKMLADEDCEFVTDMQLTPEEVALLVIRQMAGFKWRLAEGLHLCGRHTSASVLWSLSVNAEVAAGGDSDEVLKRAWDFCLDKKYSSPVTEEDTINPDVTGFAQLMMNEVDNELATTLQNLFMSLVASKEFVDGERTRLLEDQNFSKEDWVNLDWPTLFHSIGTPFDPAPVSLLVSDTGELSKIKFTQLQEAFEAARNRNEESGNCEPITPALRQAVEQILASVLDTIEPCGIEEARAKGKTSFGMSQ